MVAKKNELQSSIAKVEHRKDQRIVWNQFYQGEGKRYGELPSIAAQLALPELTKLSLLHRDDSLLFGPDDSRAKGVSLLELGCGYGRDLLFFKKFIPSLRITAMDWAVRAVESLQHEIAERSISAVKPIVADVLESPLGDESYDVIYTNYLFHYLDKSECGHLLDRCISWLNEKGVLMGSFVSTSDVRLLRSPKPENKSVEVYPNLIWHFFDGQELCEILEAHGLQLFCPLKEVAEWEAIGLGRELTVFWFVIAKKG